MYIALWVAGLLVVGGCSSVQLGRGKKKVVLVDYAEGRVVEAAITDRLTGAKEMLFVSMPQKTLFVEGYIQGLVTDYNDNPIQGVVVRAMAEGESREGGKAFQSSAFDPSVSDTNGVYRIRFSLPIVNRMVDIRGKFIYNPGWEQERANLGKAYEPQMKESPFRLIFDARRGMIVFAEGVRKLIVQPVRSDLPARSQLPGAKPPREEKKEEPKKEEDIFKGMEFGP